MASLLFDLSPAVGRNRYCGPGALAILLGLDTDEAAARLRAVTGRRAIRRIGWFAMVLVINQRDARAVPCGVAPGATLRSFADALVFDGVYLVNITGHFVVLRKGDGRIDVADNHTIYPMPLAKFRRLRSRVKGAWKVVR